MKLLSGKWLLNATQKPNTLEAVKRQEAICCNKLKLLQGRNALDDILERSKKKKLAYCIHLPLNGTAKRENQKGLVCF